MRRKIFILLFVNAMLGIAGGFVLSSAAPQYYFPLYWLIPVYYTVLGMIYAAVMFHRARVRPRGLLNTFMLMRGVKFLVTVAGIVLYLSLDGVQRFTFCLVMMIFYFMYMFVETYLYYNLEQRRRKHGLQ